MLATYLCFGVAVLQPLLVSSWGGARSFGASMVLSQFCVQFVVIHLDFMLHFQLDIILNYLFFNIIDNWKWTIK